MIDRFVDPLSEGDDYYYSQEDAMATRDTAQYAQDDRSDAGLRLVVKEMQRRAPAYHHSYERLSGGEIRFRSSRSDSGILNQMVGGDANTTPPGREVADHE